MKLAGRFAHRKLPEYLFPGGAPRHRRGYSHWRECIVNLQTENGDHFSLRNRRGIRNSASNGGFGADFTGPGTDLPFCVVGPACPAGFAMQNIFGVAPCRRLVDGMAGGAVVSSDAVFEGKGSGKQKLLAAFNHAEKRGGLAEVRRRALHSKSAKPNGHMDHPVALPALVSCLGALSMRDGAGRTG